MDKLCRYAHKYVFFQLLFFIYFYFLRLDHHNQYPVYNKNHYEIILSTGPSMQQIKSAEGQNRYAMCLLVLDLNIDRFESAR